MSAQQQKAGRAHGDCLARLPPTPPAARLHATPRSPAHPPQFATRTFTSPQASKGSAQLLRLLLKHGAKVNARDSTGSSPLHRAASAGKAEAVRLLVEEGGAKLDVKDKMGATPLFVAIESHNTNIALFLAAKGASLDVATKEGQTPLSIAGEMANTLLSAAQQNGMYVDE